ncbi:AraC family transcriptional regulator N-terminal domain-containing protein, partial [Rhizobium leguminosarum]|uniref:AraC family transcriptional regulator N-terminal domain-containing protein n=1 Tax=Rhizobium leguminosarum TaxID=384 RepID=UPI003F9BED86
RMLQLMERPQDIPALAPAYELEILYRVLQGPQGRMLLDIAAPDSALSRIRLAIRWVREHYARRRHIDRYHEVARWIVIIVLPG